MSLTDPTTDQPMPGYVGYCSTCMDDVPVYRAGTEGTVEPGSICCARCQRVMHRPGGSIAIVSKDFPRISES